MQQAFIKHQVQARSRERRVSQTGYLSLRSSPVRARRQRAGLIGQGHPPAGEVPPWLLWERSWALRQPCV